LTQLAENLVKNSLKYRLNNVELRLGIEALPDEGSSPDEFASSGDG